eukprot:TRINITY_DN6600_c0_g1_i2.p1 TRINITY_DN6600_c0_g1~~TRINITY_DN6600_c0_g1_i2.p1  ORF type:complete len:144 (-),score=47.39 TRINITY_DN6600_c0_g1_i2:31-462(-)
MIRYVEKDYYLQILELKPDNPQKAVSVIETDVNVDFAPPVGYVEPTYEKPEEDEEIDPELLHEDELFSESSEEETEFAAFEGNAVRISGKETGNIKKVEEPTQKQRVLNGGNIIIKNIPKDTEDKPKESTFKAFSGTGLSLRG